MADGHPRAPIASCRVLELPGHGYSLRAVTLTGQVLVVPLRRLPVDRLRDWLIVDEGMNGRPRWAERLRRRLWLARAALRQRLGREVVA